MNSSEDTISIIRKIIVQLVGIGGIEKMMYLVISEEIVLDYWEYYRGIDRKEKGCDWLLKKIV